MAMLYANTGVLLEKKVFQYLMYLTAYLLHSEKHTDSVFHIPILEFMWMKRMTEVTTQCKTEFWLWCKMPTSDSIMERKVTDAGIKFLTPEGIVYFISTNVSDWAKSVSAI